MPEQRREPALGRKAASSAKSPSRRHSTSRSWSGDPHGCAPCHGVRQESASGHEITTETSVSRSAPASPPGTCVKRVDRGRQGLRLARNVRDEGDGRAELTQAAREGQDRARDDTGQRSAVSVTVRTTQPARPQRSGGILEPPCRPPRSDRLMARTISGNAMTAQASAAPVQRNDETMPSVSTRQRPDAAHSGRTASKQQIAGHDGRHDQAAGERPAHRAARPQKSSARERHGAPHAERQARHDGPRTRP